MRITRAPHTARSRSRLGLALAAGALAVSLAGCTLSASADSPGGGISPDGVWLLVSGSDADGELPIGAGPVTLAFGTGDEATLGSGLGGEICNAYGGSMSGGVGRSSASELRVTEVFSTQMWCEAEGLMELETRYLAALQDVTEAQLIDGAIVMAGDQVRLRFVQQ